MRLEADEKVHAAFLVGSRLSNDDYAHLIDLIPDGFTAIDGNLEATSQPNDICLGSIVRYYAANFPTINFYKRPYKGEPDYDRTAQISNFVEGFRPKHIVFERAGFVTRWVRGDDLTLPVIKTALAAYFRNGYRGSLRVALSEHPGHYADDRLRIEYLIADGHPWKEASRPAVVFCGREFQEGDQAFLDHFLQVGKSLNLEEWQTSIPVA